MADSSGQSVLFATTFSKPLQVAFDEPTTTSDGGAVLLKAIDGSLGLTARMAASVQEGRAGGKIRHSTLELLRQRVFGIACGYVDGNDAARMNGDPMQRLLCDLDPRAASGLASQPTLSRFENSVSSKDLFRMATVLAESVIARQRQRLTPRKVRRITIDLDGTVDPTHGAQQLALFHGFYDTWCYLPLLGFLTFNDEAEHYLFAAILRPGRAREVDGTLGLLQRTIPRLRAEFPRARILVRLDAGFKGPELFSLLDDFEVDYVVGMAENSVLARQAGPLLKRVRKLAGKKKETVRLYGDTWYSAKSWRKIDRRVVIKAEVLARTSTENDAKDNPRYVVTSLTDRSPQAVYELYCQRGDAENRIKELKYDLAIDRTSCSSFRANQLRVLLAAAAYVLYQELRTRIDHGPSPRPQVGTLRLRLIKIGGRMLASVRRYVLHLAQNHPWRELWQRLAQDCGALTPPATG